MTVGADGKATANRSYPGRIGKCGMFRRSDPRQNCLCDQPTTQSRAFAMSQRDSFRIRRDWERAIQAPVGRMIHSVALG